MENEKKNLIVLFPGAGYTVGSPLLYYADLKYANKGYERQRIGYGECLRIDGSRDEIFEATMSYVYEQVKDIDFAKYEDVLFVSKSLGTVLAGWLADKLGCKIRHIYLTPIDDTLVYLKHGKNISLVVAGTADDSMDTTVLLEHCEREKIAVELIEGADHRLEIVGEPDANIDILKKIVALY